jgi:hypothetical protein
MLKFIKQYTGEYFSEVLQNARKTSPEYETAVQERILHSQVVGSLLSDNEKGTQLRAYLESIHDATLMESELLYFQGYLDCIEILRFLRII